MLDFKSLRKAEMLVARVRNGEARTALIVGHGFIGVELALMLTDLGVEVTVVGRRPWVMPRVLDRPTSDVARHALELRGVELRLGTPAEAFVETSTGTAVRLADGEMLHADLVVAATGVKPHTEFLDGSGDRRRTGGSTSTTTCAPRSPASTPPATWPRPPTG